jgi:hypothetical protein
MGPGVISTGIGMYRLYKYSDMPAEYEAGIITVAFYENNNMPGRNDDNKHGSAGRGNSNPSKQPLGNDSDEQSTSDQGMEEKGGKRSEPSPRKDDQDTSRSQPAKDSKKKQDRGH